MELDVLIEAPGWNEVRLEALAERAARASLTHLGLNPDVVEISVLGCDDARIAVLNADFRGKPMPTNVLSWPTEDRAADTPGAAPQVPGTSPGDLIDLGDIAIALQTCLAEAESAGRDASAHVSHLLVHGILHLLGYDHIDDLDAALMERLEVEILATLGIGDPYST